MIDPNKMHRLIELSRRRDELEALLDEVKKEQNHLSLSLAEDFVESGVQNVKTPGGTLYRHRSLNVRLMPDEEDGDKSYTKAYNALAAAGQGWMIKETVAHQTLQAWVRDCEKNKTEIPEEVIKHLRTWEEFRVRVRLDGGSVSE